MSVCANSTSPSTASASASSSSEAGVSPSCHVSKSSKIPLTATSFSVLLGPDQSYETLAVGLSAFDGDTWDGGLYFRTYDQSPSEEVASFTSEDSQSTSVEHVQAEDKAAHIHIPTPAGVTAVQWLTSQSSSSACVAAGSDDGYIYVWKVDQPAREASQKHASNYTSELLHCFSEHDDAVSCLAVLKTLSHQLVSAACDDTIHLWDLTQSQGEKITPLWSASGVHSTTHIYTVDTHPTHTHEIITAAADCRAVIHDTRISAGSLSSTSSVALTLHAPITKAQYHPQNEFLFLLATETGSLVLADKRKFNQPLATEWSHRKCITDMSFHSSGSYVAVTSADRYVTVHSMTRDMPIVWANKVRDSAECVAWSSLHKDQLFVGIHDYELMTVRVDVDLSSRNTMSASSS